MRAQQDSMQKDFNTPILLLKQNRLMCIVSRKKKRKRAEVEELPELACATAN